MNRKIFALFALTAGMHLAVHASENVNTTENRQFLKQQETLSQQLREKPDIQLQAWAEQQVRANPLQHSDNQFLDELVRKQQAAQKDKPQQGAVYFVSFSIPEEGLKRMLGETRHYGIPATLRGMVNNDLKTTAEAVLSLVKDGATDGVQIDPTLFHSTAFAAYRHWWCSAVRDTTSSGEICGSARRWRKWPPRVTAGRWLMIYWQGKEIPGNETYFTSDTGSGYRYGTG